MCRLFRPLILATHPSGARLPRRMARCPCGYSGAEYGRMTSWPAGGSAGIGAQVLRDGRARDGDAVAVQQPVVEQDFHRLRNAAGGMQIGDREPAGGLHFAQYRYALAYGLEVIDRQRNLGRVRHRKQVQHRIGRAAGRHDNGDGVLERGSRDDLTWLEIPGNRVHQRAGRIGHRVGLLRIRIGLRRGAWQRHAHSLDRARHGVGGVHAAAGAEARAGIAFDPVVIFLAHLAGAVGADGFERRHDSQGRTLPVTGLDGAAVAEHRRIIHAQHRHHGARHVLVAAAHHQYTIHELRLHRRLDGIGDHLTGRQREFHALGAHGDAIGHGGEAEQLRHRARLPQGLLGARRQWSQPGIAGVHRGVTVGNPDDRLLEIRISEADRAQHGTIGRARDAMGDDATTAVAGHCC